MPPVETLMEEEFQPMDMEEENVIDDAVMVPLRTLMDVDTVVVPPQQELSAASAVINSPSAPRGKTAKDAALLTGINIRTAQHYIKKYNDDEERRLPSMLMNTQKQYYLISEELCVKRSQTYRYQYPHFINTWFRNVG
ncbi:hypothetical protein VKS41_008889 [Umbelopsis sp. WA50703]